MGNEEAPAEIQISKQLPVSYFFTLFVSFFTRFTPLCINLVNPSTCKTVSGFTQKSRLLKTGFGERGFENGVWRTEFGEQGLENRVWRTEFGERGLENEVWRTEFGKRQKKRDRFKPCPPVVISIINPVILPAR